MGLMSILTLPGGRDYSLGGPELRRAAQRGLTGGQWYKTPVPRTRLKQLMQRKNWPGIRDSLLWLAILIGSAIGGVHYWGGWAALPFFMVYGVMYGSAADSRLHECSHRTAFRASWLNDVVYYFSCFLMMRSPTANRWSHTRHHTYTSIVGADPEISSKRPPQLIMLALDCFSLIAGPKQLASFVQHAFGKISNEERAFIPKTELGKVIWEDRITVGIYVGTVVACIAMRSILPAMLIGLPRFYGRWLLMIIGLTQHLGLDEDVLDHRLNSRTVYMNPILRFIYWNMNYHVEHHMYPMVPYHALPRLHEAVKADTPPPYAGTVEAYAEIIPALVKQTRDPSYHVARAVIRPKR